MPRFIQLSNMKGKSKGSSSLKYNEGIKDKNQKTDNLGAPVIWIIDKGLYTEEKSGGGKPVFHYNGYSYEGNTAGSGSIAWYILCSNHLRDKPCYTQGVQHADGRLLMLRLHNHASYRVKTPPKRPIKLAESKILSRTSNATRRLNKERRSLPPKRHQTDSLRSSINRKWKNANATTSIANTLSDDEVKVCSLEDSLLSTVQDRWRAARRKSVITRLRSAVVTACL